jgi:transcriptional regulator with XRE-family HTH domain
MNSAKIIKSRRVARGLTQSQLARELGVPDVYVSRWERGVAVPPPATAQRLESVLGGDIREYLNLFSKEK